MKYMIIMIYQLDGLWYILESGGPNCAPYVLQLMTVLC